MAELITVRVEELMGDADTENVYLAVPRASVGHVEVGQTLSASPSGSGVPGLSFLTYTFDPANNHQATLEELVGDADLSTLYINTPREMLGENVQPGQEYSAVLTQRPDGMPLLVVIVQAPE